MLIGRFQIHVRRITQLGIRRQDGGVRNAGVDPDIDRVGPMASAVRQTEFPRQRRVIEFEPNIRAALRHDIRQFPDPFRIENRFTLAGIKNR